MRVELAAVGAVSPSSFFGIEIGRDDLGAFGDEGLGNGAADALPGGGDEADFSLQTIGHGILRLL